MNRKVHVRFGGGPLEKYPYGQLAGSLSYLTLPRDMVLSLSLPRRGFIEVELADGSSAALDVYEARVLWHGRSRPVPVYETGEAGGPLVGMSLLRGSRLEAEIVPGGEVVVHPLP